MWGIHSSQKSPNGDPAGGPVGTAAVMYCSDLSVMDLARAGLYD